MAKKKCKCPPPGAPDWMVTYGDMVTLLLCFFVLIVSLSEIKKEDVYQSVVKEIQKAFGVEGGGGRLPTKQDPELSLIERMEAAFLRQQREPNRSDTVDPGIEGPERNVTRIREGWEYVIGGGITFAPGSADLTAHAREQLKKVVDRHKLRGTLNLIELRGHASSAELGESDPTVKLSDETGRYSDLWALSAARAHAVMQYLTGPEVGLSPERFRLIARADHEPLVQRAYTSSEQEPNRRVEILVSEDLVPMFQSPQRLTDS